MKNNFFKALFQVATVGAVFGVSLAVFLINVVGESPRWCDLPCHGMRQTCKGKTPDPALTCAGVNGAIQAWRKANGHDVTKDVQTRSIEWQSTPAGSWRDTCSQKARRHGGWKVGLRPGEDPCSGSLKHTLWHSFLAKYKGGADTGHSHPSWQVADKPTHCREDGGS